MTVEESLKVFGVQGLEGLGCRTTTEVTGMPPQLLNPKL